MERIVLELDDAAGKIYRNLSVASRGRLVATINAVLKKTANDLSRNEYMSFLDSVSDEAERNGLTQEILDDLLKSDD